MDDLESIYTDIIMENSIKTHNKYKLSNKDKEEHGHNPSCGDDITLQIKFDGEEISKISFTGHGCAISQASTSIMIDLLKGKTKKEAKILIDIFIKMVNGEKIEDNELEKIGDARAFKNISKIPARVKCATLAWETMKRVLES